MNKRRLAYFSLPAIILLLSLVLELLADSGMTLAMNFTLHYIIRFIIILCTLASIVGAFTVSRRDGTRLFASLGGAALLIVMDYYLSLGQEDCDNLLWMLPMVMVVYVLKYKVIAGTLEEEMKE